MAVVLFSLRAKDNLCIKDKETAPKVSFIQRLHYRQLVFPYGEKLFYGSECMVVGTLCLMFIRGCIHVHRTEYTYTVTFCCKRKSDKANAQSALHHPRTDTHTHSHTLTHSHTFTHTHSHTLTHTHTVTPSHTHTVTPSPGSTTTLKVMEVSVRQGETDPVLRFSLRVNVPLSILTRPLTPHTLTLLILRPLMIFGQ